MYCQASEIPRKWISVGCLPLLKDEFQTWLFYSAVDDSVPLSDMV